jgi:hypothetical protein
VEETTANYGPGKIGLDDRSRERSDVEFSPEMEDSNRASSSSALVAEVLSFDSDFELF